MFDVYKSVWITISVLNFFQIHLFLFTSTTTIQPYPKLLQAWGRLGPLPRRASALPSWLCNSPRTRPPPPSQPHQRSLKVAFAFQTSPHQRGLRINHSLPTLTVISRWWAVLAWTTEIWLTSSRIKNYLQFRTTIWTYQLSPKKSETSPRYSMKGSWRSTQQRRFSPSTTSLTLYSSQGRGVNP